jgi:8-oxo-dGTP diphosphatase
MTTDPSEATPGPELRPHPVVTSFLEYDGRILLLRRSTRVSTYQGRWAGVSGSIDAGHTPEQQARIEIREETGLTDAEVELLAVGDPVVFDDAALGQHWIVHPFRFAVRQPERIRIDWEHVEQRWVAPAELGQFETVPRLAEAWERVRPASG